MQYGPKLNQIPPHICSLSDYERLAREVLSPEIMTYIDSGSSNENTLKRNLTAFDEIQLYNRVLTDVQQGHTRTQLLGRELKHPVLLGPVAYQRLAHPDGELATAQAAQATDSTMVVSTLASQPLEHIAAQTQYDTWFQLYIQPQKKDTADLVEKATNAGYSALVVTVDVPINGIRSRIQRSGFVMPTDVSAVNLPQGEPAPHQSNADQSPVFQGWMTIAPTWEDIRWLRQHTPLPIILKGLMHPDDIVKACEVGADGVIVSNHGGRALDCVPSPLEVLPSARERLGPDYPLLIDGGIRSGGDVFKALALGANAVLIGRPQMYGLAVAGALGVAHSVALLLQELEITMALTGCATLTDINPNCLAISVK